MDLELTRFFVKVVQNGSFSRAAEIMKVPKSTMSKAITRLENETGTKLLLRTTRSLTLTATGRVFYDSTLGPIQLLEDAQRSLYGSDSILSGIVRLTASEDLGNHVIAPAIAELSRKHPELRFELVYTDAVMDLIKDGVDLAIRIGKLRASNFKVRRLGAVFLIPIAAPAYLKGREKIRAPKDLLGHDCMSYRDQSLHPQWVLKSKSETVHVPIKVRIASNQMTSLLKMALAGAGIAFVPRYLCQGELDAGNLVTVLPEWQSLPYPVSIVSPLPVASSVRLKMTAGLIADAVQRALQNG